MPRPEQLVQRIRDALSRAQAGPTPDSDRLAIEYAQAVEQTNQRVARCLALLREGLRSEALHQAELLPPVLEDAARLDFPQARQWASFCQQAQLTVPPAIDADAVIELDEAYPLEQRLSEALTKHRRLALMRAPLPARIRVLRFLAQADADNPVWHQDLTALEQARHKQIQNEARQASQAADEQTLQALSDELREPWQIQPPQSIDDEVSRQLNQLRARQAQKKLAQLAEQVSQAKQTGDIHQLDEALKTFDNTARTAGYKQTQHDQSNPDLDPKAQQTVEQARTWLVARQKENIFRATYDRHVASLQQALAESADADTLTQRLKAVHATGLGVPDSLKRETESSIAAQRKQVKQQKLVKTGGIAAAAVVALAAITTIGIQSSRKQAQSQTYDELLSLVREQAFETASMRLQTLREDHPSWLEQERFTTIASQIDAWQDTQRNQEAAFEQTLQQLQTLGPGVPSQQVIEAAQAQVQNESQQKQLDTFLAEHHQKLAETAEQRNAQVRQQVKELSQRLKTLQAQTPIDQWTINLNPINQSLRQLAQTPHLTPTTQTHLQNLQQQLDQASNQVLNHNTTKQVTQQAYQQLSQEVTNPVEYFGQVAKLAQDPILKTTALGQDLPKIMRTAGFVADAAGWQRDAQGLTSPRVVDLNTTRNRLRQIQRYLAEHPKGRFALIAESYAEYLKRAAVALDPDNQPLAEGSDVKVLLDSPLVDGLQTIALANGRYWYTQSTDPGQPTLPGNRVYRVFLDPGSALRGQMVDRTLTDQAIKTTTSANANNRFTPQPAAITRFADQALAYLRSNERTWETTHLKLLSILMQTPGIDPVQRVALAREFISLSRERDWTQEPALQIWDQKLATVRTDVAWTNPNDTQAQTQRQRALTVLPQVPDLQAMLDEPEAFFQFIRQNAPNLSPIAVLAAQANGDLTIAPDPLNALVNPKRISGQLLGIQPSPEEPGGWKLILAANVQASQPVWQEQAEKLPLGSLLFWIANP